ncbi:hypothetical protein BDA96_04G078700 [Sorghum bicolor]|uniref:Uncharacterized protein n=2 Tax=Sorghum bicolor TaxID=4558 RepID=A0A921R1S1_SORBI|nr:hypothetical protein BDA96_04G078700 [Sorghum bicolor]OQU84535.1 hypothetical protein SORBI_3004G072300 [Sorghum bicolor]
MVKGSSRMDKQKTGHARNSKSTVTMTVLQHFLFISTVLQPLMEEEAELKKQIEATKLRGEELKAQEKNIDPIFLRVMNGDFEGIGLEELKKCHAMLVEMKSMIDDRLK